VRCLEPTIDGCFAEKRLTCTEYLSFICYWLEYLALHWSLYPQVDTADGEGDKQVPQIENAESPLTEVA